MDLSDNVDGGEGAGDSVDANDDGQHGRGQGPEGEYQHRGDGDQRSLFASFGVLGTDLPAVVVQRGSAGDVDLVALRPRDAGGSPVDGRTELRGDPPRVNGVVPTDRGNEKGPLAVFAYQALVWSGEVGDDPVDVWLGLRHLGQAFDDPTIRLIVDLGRSTDGHGKEGDGGLMEILQHEALDGCGFGGTQRLALRLEDFVDVRGARYRERRHHDPESDYEESEADYSARERSQTTTSSAGPVPARPGPAGMQRTCGTTDSLQKP